MLKERAFVVFRVIKFLNYLLANKGLDIRLVIHNSLKVNGTPATMREFAEKSRLYCQKMGSISERDYFSKIASEPAVIESLFANIFCQFCNKLGRF